MANTTIYLVQHPQCVFASELSKAMYDWFRLGYLNGDQSGAGVPIFYRRHLDKTTNQLTPKIQLRQAQHNVIVLLVDREMVLDPHWRKAIHDLCSEARDSDSALVLPVALHDGFYRLKEIYGEFNPIRLLGYNLDNRAEVEQAIAVLRRAISESIARRILSTSKGNVTSLKVFLSHAKRDGRLIAESIRDDIRKFSQMEAWYDANDLPFGGRWAERMEKASESGTAAMVAIRTDTYPTRPWCRTEATLSRTPRQIKSVAKNRIWRIQPTVAVDLPQAQWVKGLPMLSGVPRIGWDEKNAQGIAEQVVDRLVLEILLTEVHLEVAKRIQKAEFQSSLADETCYITWVPDVWTLACLRCRINATTSTSIRPIPVPSSRIRRIIYPGYGLTGIERGELEPVLQSFHPKTQLISFEKVM